ncbi:MAG: outer membrane beta-barrel protein [Phaeodactylibacter sp.]|nr:outer membrane beta-barrel protein [Phaeodactylibacter sp.]
MKHIFLPILLLLVVLPYCLAQTKESQGIRSSFDLVMGLETGYRVLQPINNSFQTTATVHNRDQAEIPSVNYRFGLNYNQRLFGRLFLKSGIRWSQNGYKTPKSELIWPSEIDPVTGEILNDPSLPQWLILKNRYHYLEIPLHFRYHFSAGNIQPFFGIGASWNVFMHAREISITDQGRQVLSDTIRDYNPVNVALTSTFGLDFALQGRFRAFAQLVGRYHLDRLDSSTKIEEHLYNYGLEAGLRVGL